MFYTEKLIFIHISLTGGSSVWTAFGQEKGPKQFNGVTIPAHATALEVRKIMGDDEWSKRYSFTIVRNPWDKMVSIFHSWCREMKLKKHWGDKWQDVFNKTRNFESFLLNYPYENVSGMTGTIRTSQNYWAFGVDRIFMYEDFDELSVFMTELGFSGEILYTPRFDNFSGQEYKRPDIPYQNYYTKNLRDLVSTWFEEDIKLFGYSFD